MKKKKQISLTTIIFLIVAFLFLAIGLGSLGSVGTTGKSYELRVRGDKDAQEPSVFFVLGQPSGSSDIGVYYRLTNVYVHIGAIYNGEKDSAEIALGRGASATANAYTYKATVGNIGYELKHEADKNGNPVEDKTILNAVGNWIEPFDLSVTDSSNLRVSTYKYYQLRAGSCNMLIDEIVFYGEMFEDAQCSKSTGKFGVIPVNIEASAPEIGETKEQAEARAAAAVDAQKKPVMAQSSFFRLGKEEIYSMMTVSEMRMGNRYGGRNGLDTNVYNGDKVYNSLGSSILALGTLIFGNSPFGLRFFSMLASFGVLVIGFFFVKQLCKSEKAGLIFAVLYALSGYMLTLGHLGTPLMIGLFFFITALYFMYSFYNKGIKKVNALGVMPLILSGVFGAAAICVNGVYAVACLALAGLFAAGMVRQIKVRRSLLDEAIEVAEKAEAGDTKAPVLNEEGEEVPHEMSEEKKRVLAIAEEYRWKNTAAPAAFFTALVIGAMLMSLLFVLPGYYAYVKLFDNITSPRMNVFQIMAKLFAGGFTGKGVTTAFHPFYTVFAGTGDIYAVTAAVCNTVALIAGLMGVAYAVYKIVLVLMKKLEGRDARVALRRAIVPLGMIVTGTVCAAFGGGALAFIALVYCGMFMLASECARDLTETEGKLQKPAKIVTWVMLGLLCAVFLLYGVFMISIPLPASFIGAFA